jgi:hypothetical protein
VPDDQARLAGVVLEPAPAGPPPAEAPAGAAELLVLEGDGRAAPSRWLIAELEPGADAAAVLAVLAGGAPARVAFSARRLAQRDSAAFMPEFVTHVLPVAIPAPAEHVAELDAWYEQEHGDMLLRCPDWLRVRRYAIESIEGAAWSRLALHDLASPHVLFTPQLRAAMSTPWRARLAEHEWFMAEGRVPLAVRR